MSEKEYIDEYCWYDSTSNAKKIAWKYGEENNWEEILQFRKKALDHIMDAQSRFILMPWAKKFLQEMVAKSIFMVLVTWWGREESIQKIKRSELSDILSNEIPIVASDDYTQGKPYPDPYLLWKEKFIALSNNTIEEFHAFEDSVPGMLSALSAGYDKVYIIPHMWTKSWFWVYQQNSLFPKNVKELTSLANYKV